MDDHEPTGVRAAARARTMEAIRAAAKEQLATVGAAGLSLRLVARDVGLVSSAVYRYVASRDELLTMLIVEAYDSLGEAVEASARASVGTSFVERWVAAAHTVRDWALARPHDFQLLYGTPVPGYRAPQDTVTPGTRATIALAGLLRGARPARRPVAATTPPLPAGLQGDLDRLAAAVDVHLPADVVVGFVAAWTQLFGLVGFELTSQTRGFVDDQRALFDAAVRVAAGAVGVR